MRSFYIAIALIVILTLLYFISQTTEHFDVFDGSLAQGREDVPSFEVLEKESRYVPYDSKLDPTTVTQDVDGELTTYPTDRIVGSYDDYIKTRDAYDDYRKVIIDEITTLRPDMKTLKTKDIPVNYLVKRDSAGKCEGRPAVPDEDQDFPVDFSTPRPADKSPPLKFAIRAWYGWSATPINFTIDGPREYSSRIFRRTYKYVDCTSVIAPAFGLYDYIDLRPVDGTTTGAGRRPNPDKQNIFYMVMSQDDQNSRDGAARTVRMPTANGTFYVEGQSVVAYVPAFSYLNRAAKGSIPYKSVRITDAQFGRDGLWDTELAPFVQRRMKCGYILDLSRQYVYHTNLRMADPARGIVKNLVILVKIGEVVTRYDIGEYKTGSIYLPGPQIDIGDTLLRPSLPREVCDYTIRYTITMWVRVPDEIREEPIVLFSHANRTKTPPVIFNELRLYPWGLTYICASQEGQFVLNAPLKEGTFKSWTHIAIVVNGDGAVAYVNRALKGNNFQMLAPAIWPFGDYDFVVAPTFATELNYDPRLPLLPAGVRLESPVMNQLPAGVEIAKFYVYPMTLPLDYMRSKFRTIV
jgi:hypothetical protein